MRYRRAVSLTLQENRLSTHAERNIYSGIYVPNTDAYPAHFRGIGIRIEDSVCVQEEHPLVLTTEAVKEVCRSLPL